MKTKAMISIAVVSVFLLSGLALAGVDPNPFRSEINQLGAVANILNSALNRVEKVMGVDPEPFYGGVVTALEGARDAAQSIVVSIDSRLPLNDTTPFGTAVRDVRDSAQEIVDTA